MSANETIYILPVKEALDANDKLKEKTSVDAPAAVQSMLTTKSLVRQIRLLGMLGRAYIKEVKGKEYIIFKGNAAARALLPGTRYLKTNPHVAMFVVGTKEIVRDAGKAFKIAVVAYVAIDVMQEVLADRFSMARLLTKVTSDVLQAAISGGAGALAGVIAVSIFGAPCVLAFAITFAVGFGVAVALTKLDQKFRLTDRAVARMMSIEAKIAKEMRVVRHDLKLLEQKIEKLIVEAHVIDRYWRLAEEMMSARPQLIPRMAR